MDPKRTILVFGAGGTTGRAIVAQALDSGHAVRAADPEPPPHLPPHPYLEARSGNLLEDDLAPLLDGVDAVVSAVGIGLSAQSVLDPAPLYTEGTMRLVQAMRRAGTRRLVVISAAFAGPRAAIPPWFRAAAYPVLGRVFAQMADMERLLRVSDGVDWTAVRPGWLLDLPFTGDYVVFENTLPAGMLRTRHADLAHFMVRCATSSDWIGGTPAIARREGLRHSSPPALLDEIRRTLHAR